MSKNTQLSAKQEKQLEIGKRFESLMELGYVTKKEAMLFSFLKGIAAGFGAFIGGTIVVGIVLWIISLLEDTPVNQLIN